MLLLRVSHPKPVNATTKTSRGVRYVAGVNPAYHLLGKKVRLRNIPKSKSVGKVIEIISDPTEVTLFGKNMIPKNINVIQEHSNTSIWVSEKDILKVIS